MKEVYALMCEYHGEGGGAVVRCYTDELRATQDQKMLVENDSVKWWKVFKVLLVEGSGLVTEWGMREYD